MTVRLLANENFPRPTLLALRAAGVEVESVGERMPSASDDAVLARADFVAGHLVVISGQSVRRRALPLAAGA